MKVSFKFEAVNIIEEKIELEENKLFEYTLHLKNVLNDNSYLLDESSIYLPLDTDFYDQSYTLAKKYKTEKLRFVFVIGIGGSNLGTQAVYNAIRGNLNQITNDLPKLIFLETTSAKYIEDVFKLINTNVHSKDDFVVNIISKSGSTTETIAIAKILLRKLEERFVNVKDRIIVTTDKDSRLEILSKRNEFEILNIPKKVGGRYSIFSNVGLFPLALAGIEIDRLLEGAKVALVDLVNTNNTNPSLRSAVIRYLLNKEGFYINNQFYFNPELEYCGRWYRQLIGESLGKLSNKDTNEGIFPVVSVGSTDLHSMLQLYLGGPKNVLTYFVYSPSDITNQKIIEDQELNGLVESIEGKSTVEIMNAIYKGTKVSYVNNKLPFVEIDIPLIDEYTLGMYLQYSMLEVMYLAKLMNVNAFDQPSVEEYKIATKKILKS